MAYRSREIERIEDGDFRPAQFKSSRDQANKVIFKKSVYYSEGIWSLNGIFYGHSKKKYPIFNFMSCEIFGIINKKLNFDFSAINQRNSRAEGGKEHLWARTGHVRSDVGQQWDEDRHGEEGKGEGDRNEGYRNVVAAWTEVEISLN